MGARIQCITPHRSLSHSFSDNQFMSSLQVLGWRYFENLVPRFTRLELPFHASGPSAYIMHADPAPLSTVKHCNWLSEHSEGLCVSATSRPGSVSPRGVSIVLDRTDLCSRDRQTMRWYHYCAEALLSSQCAAHELECSGERGFTTMCTHCCGPPSGDQTFL